MEPQKQKAVEAQKEAADDKVFAIKTKVANIINTSGDFSPKPHQLIQYKSIVNELSVCISEYSTDVESLMRKLKGLPLHPDKALDLKQSYQNVILLTDELREDIEGNSAFKVNKKDTVAISANYLDYFKESVIGVQEITASHDRVKVVNKNLLNEKADLENSRNEVLKELDMLRNENKRRQTLIDNSDEIVKKSIAEKEKVNLDLVAANKELTHFKEVAQKTEVARNSTNFHNQAEANKKAAKNWGICILALIVVFISAIFILFSNSGELFDLASDILQRSKGMEPGLLKQLILIEIVKKVATRLVTFSLIIYSISFLVKNYNAQMHNYIINSHKANALRSTVDLIGTAKQDDGNDKIILQATQAIFTNQKSGYQGVESEPSSPNLITNVIDAVSGGKK